MEEQTPKAPVPAIEVRDLKKSFRIYNDKSSLLKDRLLFWKRNKYQTREVLRGLTFDVAPGEAVVTLRTLDGGFLDSLSVSVARRSGATGRC